MITVSGSLTIQNNTGQHTIQAKEFTKDRHINGTGCSLEYNTGDWSVERTVDTENGQLSYGDWETDSCTIVKDNIVIKLEVY